MTYTSAIRGHAGVAACVIAMWITAAPSEAYAQSINTDAASNGVKVGATRVHPYAEADTHFVLNPGRLNSDGPNDVVLAIRPGLDFALTTGKIDLKFVGDAEYRRYLGIDNAATSDLSTLAYNADLKVLFNRDGAVTFGLYDYLTRSADPGNQTFSNPLKHIANEVGINIEGKPGGGALVISGGYGFFYDRYDRTAQFANAASLDNMRHMPRLKIAWKFLPRTAFFLESNATYTNYSDHALTADGTTFTSNADSIIANGALGANGFITGRIAMLLKVGYGSTFIAGTDQYRSVIGQAEGRFILSEFTRLFLGYTRSVAPTPLFKYVGSDEIYAGGTQAIGGRGEMSLRVSYTFLNFGDSIVPTGAARNDGSLAAVFGFDYQVAEWAVVTVGDRLEARNSNFTSGGTRPGAMNAGYLTNDMFLRLTIRY